MAEILIVNGDTVAPSEQIGRDIQFIGINAANAVLETSVGGGSSITNLDLVRRVIDTASSITLIGEVSSNSRAVTFMVEGLGFAGPGSPTLQAELNAIRDAVEAISALGTTVCTFAHIEGVAFVVDLTDT